MPVAESRPIRAVLFDLGGTLVRYYEREEFPVILREAIASVARYLQEESLPIPPTDVVMRATTEENHEAPDHSVRPMELRLTRIFRLDDRLETLRSGQDRERIISGMCRAFMEPIFSRSSVYPDARQALEWVRKKGYATLIVSNTSWGSPREVWEEEIARHGLTGLVDGFLCCRDVGWRKPAPAIFHEALRRTGAAPTEAVFVGDDPRWDIAGPLACGITPVLVDRDGKHSGAYEISIRTLSELPEVLNRLLRVS